MIHKARYTGKTENKIFSFIFYVQIEHEYIYQGRFSIRENSCSNILFIGLFPVL